MSEYGGLEQDLRPGNASRFRQICAIIYKNFLVQTRSRWRCCGGIGALCVDIFFPVAFIAMMSIARRFPEGDTPPQVNRQYPLRDADWGQKYHESKGRLILLTPKSNETEAVASLLGIALACTPPGQAASGTHFRPVSDSFGDFWREGLPFQCEDAEGCPTDPRCGPALLSSRFVWADDGDAVTEVVLANPSTFGAAIVFGDPSGGTGAPLDTFELRVNHTSMPSTLTTFSDFAVGTVKMTQLPDSDWHRYFWATNLLHAVERSLMARWLHGDNATVPLDVGANVKGFPWPSKHIYTGPMIAGMLFIFVLVFAFQVPASSMVKSIVQEKELRLREYMRVLGLLRAAYWGSWFVTHLCMLLVTGALCAIVGRSAFPESSPVVLMLFYWAAAAALISFSYFLAGFFSRTQLASLLSPLIYFLAMLPAFIAVSFQPAGGIAWFLACLLPPSALAMFAMTLVAWSTNGAGVTWATLGRAVATAHPHFSSASVILMLLLDTVLYFVLMLLLDEWESADGLLAALCHAVTKGLERIKSPHLLTQVSSMPRASIGALLRGTPLLASDSPTSSRSGGSVPRMPPEHVVIKTDALTREYATNRGVKLAVDALDLEVYDRHVTALLGHNGAGKSTTIGMLTGMLPPSGGTAIVDGRDVERDMPRLRASLGVCPQYDMLWPLLTVREHLRIYAALRGIPKADVPDAANTAAAEVDLLDRLDVRSEELSGGQRRKLSVAIAFLGNPRIVFLDEPTSGMDPAAKRFTWDVITRHKRRRAVVLTTHSMEEADALSDQIVILAQGRRAAQGSPFDLKERYGVGYTLTVVCHDGRDARPSGDSRGSGGWARAVKSSPGAVCEGMDAPHGVWPASDVGMRQHACAGAAVQLSEPGDGDMNLPQGGGARGMHSAQHAAVTLLASSRQEPRSLLCVDHAASKRHAVLGAVQRSADAACCDRQEHSSSTAWHERRESGWDAARGVCCPWPGVDMHAARQEGGACRIGRSRRRGGAVAESSRKGSGQQSDDIEPLADMASLIERSGSSGTRGRPPRHPGGGSTSGARSSGGGAAQPSEREHARWGGSGQVAAECGSARGADVPRLLLQKVLPGAASRSRTPDSSTSSRKQRSQRSQRSDVSLPLRSASSGDAGETGAGGSQPNMPPRGARTLRSDMLSFGMHTHSSMDLESSISAAEAALAAHAAGQAPGPARVRASPRSRGRRNPSAPAGLQPTVPSPRLPTHPEDAPSEPPLLDTAHARHGSWLITGSLGGVFGSGGLSPSSDGHTPTADSGELFPEEDIFVQSETYRRHIQDAAAMAPSNVLAAEGGVQALVRSHVPQASVLTRCADEVSFRLPRASVTEFPNLLRGLEGSKDDLGIRSYGLSVTTLEEVFLRIASEMSPEAASSPARSPPPGRPFTTPRTDGTISQPTSEDPTPRAFLSPSVEQPLLSGAPRMSRVTRAANALRRHALGPTRDLPLVADPFECPRRRGLLLWGCQVRAVARKHVRTALREPWVVATQLAVPLLLVLAAVLFGKRQSRLRQEPPLPLDPLHTLDNYHGFVAGSPAARASPLFDDFEEGLGRAWVPWNATALDPAPFPYTMPEPDTADGYIAAHWNSSMHVYTGIFVESLHPRTRPTSAPVATARCAEAASAGLASQTVGARAALAEAAQMQPQRDRVAAGGAGLGAGGGVWSPHAGLAAPVDTVWKAHAGLEYTVMVNQTAKHALPYAISVANNGMLRALLSQQAGNASPVEFGGMQVTLQPFPTVPTERRVVISAQMKRVSLTMFTALALSVLAASFIVVPVKERSSGSMHVQIVSGLNPLALWPSLLAMDMLIFAIPGAIIVAFLSWSTPETFSLARLPITASFMALFGLASISQMYAWHFWFIEEMNALVVASAATSATGIMGFFMFIVCEKLETAEHSSLFSAFFWLLRTFLHLCSPAFLAMRLLFQMVCTSPAANAWAWDIGGQSIMWLGIQAALYLTVLLVVSSGVLCDVIYLIEGAVSQRIPSKVQRLIDAPLGREAAQFMSQAVGGQTSTSDGAFAAAQDHLPAVGIGSSADLGESGWLSTHLSAGSNATGSGGGAADGGGADGAAAAGSLSGRRMSNGSSDRSGGDPAHSIGGGTPNTPSGQSSPETLLPPAISERSFQGWASFGGFGNATPPAHPWPVEEAPESHAASSGAVWEGAGGGADSDIEGGVLAAGVRVHSALVAAADPAGYMVLLRNVSKVFGGGSCRGDATVAVKKVSLAIPAGHCFGLLGTNGAGKTTIFRMMTSDTRPTRGDVFLAGWRLNFSLPSSLARLATGYCPQAGGLTVALTPREILEFYARMRGLPSAAVPAAVDHVLCALCLEEQAAVPVRALSGGNKRRLSVAVALIGAPQVLLLDEPSTGMDPTARRRLWAALQAARHAGHTIVLTSHTMADADVLCTRVGILVNGELRCVGSPMDLKACLNGGYVVEARLPRRSHGSFVAGLRDAFPSARLTVVEEPWSDIVVVTVSDSALDVPRLYEVVEDLHAEFEGQSYAVSQASLEHVFMHVVHGEAGDVVGEDEDVAGIDGDASRSGASTPAALDGGFKSFGDMGALIPEGSGGDAGSDGGDRFNDFTFGSVRRSTGW
eukprot:jgi/Ulvmu1/12471/UM009_0123.1